MTIFSNYGSEDQYIPTSVDELELGDYISLEEETIWDEAEFGPLENPREVYVVDAFQEGEDEDGQIVWHVIVESAGQEVILAVTSEHRFYALEK